MRKKARSRGLDFGPRRKSPFFNFWKGNTNVHFWVGSALVSTEAVLNFSRVACLQGPHFKSRRFSQAGESAKTGAFSGVWLQSSAKSAFLRFYKVSENVGSKTG